MTANACFNVEVDTGLMLDVTVVVNVYVCMNTCVLHHVWCSW